MFLKGRFACPDTGGDALLRDPGGGVQLGLLADGVRGEVRRPAAERARQVFGPRGFTGRGRAENPLRRGCMALLRQAVEEGVAAAHGWRFKAKLRARAYGWRGSALAVTRLKEALSEIKTVAPVEASSSMRAMKSS